MKFYDRGFPTINWSKILTFPVMRGKIFSTMPLNQANPEERIMGQGLHQCMLEQISVIPSLSEAFIRFSRRWSRKRELLTMMASELCSSSQEHSTPKRFQRIVASCRHQKKSTNGTDREIMHVSSTIVIQAKDLGNLPNVVFFVFMEMTISF